MIQHRTAAHPFDFSQGKLVSGPTTGLSFLCWSVVLQRFQFLQICGATSAVATALRAVRASTIAILYGRQRAGPAGSLWPGAHGVDRPTRSSTIQRFDASLARRSLGVGGNDLIIAFAPAFLSLCRYAITG